MQNWQSVDHQLCLQKQLPNHHLTSVCCFHHWNTLTEQWVDNYFCKHIWWSSASWFHALDCSYNRTVYIDSTLKFKHRIIQWFYISKSYIRIFKPPYFLKWCQFFDNFYFSQKTNQTHSGYYPECVFFLRIYGWTILFRDYLTFRHYKKCTGNN